MQAIAQERNRFAGLDGFALKVFALVVMTSLSAGWGGHPGMVPSGRTLCGALVCLFVCGGHILHAQPPALYAAAVHRLGAHDAGQLLGQPVFCPSRRGDPDKWYVWHAAARCAHRVVG